MSTSARAKQMLFKKDRVFEGEQKRWIERFLATARASGGERLYMQQCIDILVHVETPRALLLTLGQSIPVAGGKQIPAPTLSSQELLARVKRLMYDAKRCFGADDVLLLKLRHLAEYCGATRDDLVNVLTAAPPDF